jgi:hypothetical protein
VGGDEPTWSSGLALALASSLRTPKLLVWLLASS